MGSGRGLPNISISSGFLNCLGKDGQVYDKTKYGWMQGRQVWMFARLYNDVERFKKQEILDAAINGKEIK